MTKRMLLVFGLLFLLVLAAVVVRLNRVSPKPEPGVTLENFRRLHRRMSDVEVEAILGPPEKPTGVQFGPPRGMWKGEHCSVRITFHDAGCSGQLLGDDGEVLDLAAPAWEPLRASLGFWLVPHVLVACAVAIVFLFWRLARRCPGCGRSRMSRTAVIVVTGPGGSPGAFYACGSCCRQWYWSKDERAWHDATAGTRRRGSADAER